MGYVPPMNQEWQIRTPDRHQVERIQRILGCSPVTATVLANRGIDGEDGIIRYMNLSLADLRPPFAIKDMDAAVRRIAQAIEDRERVLIFGDYDVDGITAVTLLLEFFRGLGLDADYYIPHRCDEGYDLQVDHVFGVALPREADLIITVDCGSSRHEAVRSAKESGIDVIITDHHTITSPPKAAAVVNPRRTDCTAGFDHLAGVGVAFVLVVCLRKHLREKGFWQSGSEPNLKHFLDLVALGTIADMVPLVGDNRILSKIGMEVINAGRRPGLTALLKAAGVKEAVRNTDDIAFRLAPRLNAAGRLDHAKTAVELLTTRDPRRAEEIAESLNQLNRRRQETEKRILEKALALVGNDPEKTGRNALVLTHPEWHEGVLGIVASKLTNRFFRPTILISSRNGIGKGSGRSIPGINLYEGLDACSVHLEKFGGHPMAAGLQIRPDRIDAFRNDFEAWASKAVGREPPTKTIDIDCELNFHEVTETMIDELEKLLPFGEGNPEPLFLARAVQVSSSMIVGKHHRRMSLRQGNPSGRAMNAIQFNVDRGRMTDAFDQVAFRLRWNRWKGRKTAQIIIEET